MATVLKFGTFKKVVEHNEGSNERSLIDDLPTKQEIDVVIETTFTVMETFALFIEAVKRLICEFNKPKK